MKWTRPEQGTKRIKSAFLFFPKDIGGETRWLVKARWQERVTYYGPRGVQLVSAWVWEAERWLDYTDER